MNKIILDFPFLIFFFFLNDLLLVNETSCFLGKNRPWFPATCVCVCQCLQA